MAPLMRSGRRLGIRHEILLAALLIASSAVFIQSASAKPSIPPGCSTCPSDWKNVVCATYAGVSLELPNECVARCQGITQWTNGQCPTHKGRAGGPAPFRGLAESLRVTTPVSYADMTSKASEGYVYVGTYKSLRGPPTAVKSGNKKAPNMTYASEDASWATGVMVSLPHGHTYIQAKAKRSMAPVSASWPGRPPVEALVDASASNQADPKGRLLQILGADDRVNVSPSASKYPYSTTINLVYKKIDGKSYICSGALIAQNVILTAAHCIYDFQLKGWASDFTLHTPDYNTALPVAVTHMTTYKGYIQDDATIYDIAALRLDKDLGTQRGWMGVAWDCTTSKQWLRTIGYPGDMQVSSIPSLYQTECYSNSDYTPCDNKQLLHSCDTKGGQSGSPMFFFKKDKLPYVKAVLTCEYTTLATPWNCGAWMRPDIWPVIKDFLAAS